MFKVVKVKLTLSNEHYIDKMYLDQFALKALRQVGRYEDKKVDLGRGGGQVVSVLAFYYDDLSSNPPEAYSFFCKIVFEKNENKQKEAGVGPL